MRSLFFRKSSISQMEDTNRAPSVASRRSSASYRERQMGQTNQIISATYDVIVGLNEDLETISQDNLKIRQEVDKYTSQLETITKALNKNLSTVEEANTQLTEENKALIEELERRRELFDIVKPLVDQCLELSPESFQEHPNLQSLLNKIKGSKASKSYEVGLDPLLNKILPTLEYFKDCKTNNEFIQRCKIILMEIKRLESMLSDKNEIFETEYQKANVEVLRYHLRNMQGDKDVVSINYSDRIKELTKEKEKLLEERKRLIDAQVFSKNEGNKTPKRPIAVPRSSTALFSPIRRRNQESSPMRF